MWCAWTTQPSFKWLNGTALLHPHTREWYVTEQHSPAWMSHVTHLNETCHTLEWVISHTWMNWITCDSMTQPYFPPPSSCLDFFLFFVHQDKYNFLDVHCFPFFYSFLMFTRTYVMWLNDTALLLPPFFPPWFFLFFCIPGQVWWDLLTWPCFSGGPWRGVRLVPLKRKKKALHLVHMCDMTHLDVWHDSFTCVTWLIHTCDMTHSRVWHVPFTC